MSALANWRSQLEGWAIPETILAAAPVSPWGHEVSMFDRRAAQARQRETPSRRVALAALPEGGTVLDVGCGAGAASLGLAGRASAVTGVDESRDMLEAFARNAAEAGLAHTEVAGRWPDVAPEIDPADLLVCAHVLYNVAELAPFARSLHAHARRRVVVELTATHPLSWLAPYWRRFHDLERPTGPTAEDARAALAELGIAAELTQGEDPGAWDHDHDLVPFVRRRLCLTEDRDPEVRAALDEFGVPPARSLAVLWWDTF